MKIGSKLLFLRHQKSLSQEYVADKLKISQSTYSRIESDKFPPKSQHLKLLSEFYQIPISFFIANTEQGFQDIMKCDQCHYKSSYWHKN